MLKLANFRIWSKVTLVVGLLCALTVAVTAAAHVRLKEADDANTYMVTHESRATILTARANRLSQRFLSSAYQVVAATEPEAKAKYLKAIEESERSYKSMMTEIVDDMPALREQMDPVAGRMVAAMAACRDIIDAGANANTADQMMPVFDRLGAVCAPGIEQEIVKQAAIVDSVMQRLNDASADLTAKMRQTVIYLWLSVAGGAFACVALALFIGIKGIATPVKKLAHVMAAFGANDLSLDVPGTDRGDELGAMARTVEIFRANGLEVERLRADQEAQKAAAAAERRQSLDALANSFEEQVMAVVNVVSASATELQQTAGSMTSIASSAMSQANTVATTATQTTGSVQAVASAAEELSASINEISRQTAESAAIAAEAVEETARANDRISGLTMAADRIGDVVKLITDIAAQTNLLALNATIEAARAGDAGKGFAVVAGEVKNLANQTGRATEEISQQIHTVQEEIRHAIDAIKGVAQVIDRARQISSSIASSVEQQGAATQEIARNVQQAATGTRDVSHSIGEISHHASSTGTAADQLLASASDLAKNSAILKNEVLRFVEEVRHT